MTEKSDAETRDVLEGKRRKVLTNALMALAGFVGVFATRRREARAANGGPLILGQGNAETDPTTLTRAGDAHDNAFSVTNNDGPGVVGWGGDAWMGVAGISDGYGTTGQNNGPSNLQQSVAGVAGTSINNDGVSGTTSGNNPMSGVLGDGGQRGVGVTGRANSAPAVAGISGSGFGILASTTSGRAAILATASSPLGRGVYCIADTALYASGNTFGVVGFGGTASGVSGQGTGAGANGVSGWSSGFDGAGVYGAANIGPRAFGVYGGSSQGYAGYFDGKVNVTGNLFKSAGGFKIDHPMDPANKYLYHSFVESPDMINVYGGNVVTDANGDATIILPNYFEGLNRDFRYHLTVIGQIGQASVIDEIKENRFTIKTDKPNMKVSWQVTGTRQDPYAKSHSIVPEVEKSVEERGTYLHPADYGQPESKGVLYDRIHATRQPPPPDRETQAEVDKASEMARAILRRAAPNPDRPPSR